MRTLNLNGIELLSTRELATVKGGEGIPTPIIIIEDGPGAPAVEKLSTMFTVTTTTTTNPAPARRKRR